MQKACLSFSKASVAVGDQDIDLLTGVVTKKLGFRLIKLTFLHREIQMELSYSLEYLRNMVLKLGHALGVQ